MLTEINFMNSLIEIRMWNKNQNVDNTDVHVTQS